MCIIIVNKEGTLEKSIFKNCFEKNNDSAGFMFSNNGELKMYKTMNSVNGLYNKYLKVRETNNLPIIIHFRIATGGKIDMNNCHPFYINDDLGFCHNGIIDLPWEIKNHCDTVCFNEAILKELHEDFLTNKATKELLSKYISWSKLAFLNKDGKFTIINEEKGHWSKDDKNWFSNNSYVKYEPVKTSYDYNAQRSLFNDKLDKEYEDYKQKCVVGAKKIKFVERKCFNCGVELSTLEEEWGCCDACFSTISDEERNEIMLKYEFDAFE